MTDIDEETRQDAARRTALVDQLEAAIRANVPKEHQLIDEPAILAELLERFSHDRRDFQSCTFEATLGVCVGRVITHETNNLVWLADTLHAQGYTEENQYDFGYADRYAFSLENTEKRKVFALRTQNVNYLVLMVSRYRGWELHMREWWDVLPAAAERYLPYGLEKYIKGETLTLDEAMRLSRRFGEYADDLPGVDFPERLRLQAFKATGFVVGKDSACAGLRYGDARDRGYIVTIKGSPFDIPEADKMTWHSLSRLHYVWYDLLSAIDTFREELADSDDAASAG